MGRGFLHPRRRLINRFRTACARSPRCFRVHFSTDPSPSYTYAAHRVYMYVIETVQHFWPKRTKKLFFLLLRSLSLSLSLYHPLNLLPVFFLASSTPKRYSCSNSACAAGVCMSTCISRWLYIYTHKSLRPKSEEFGIISPEDAHSGDPLVFERAAL